ncbi:MAG: preprotein translocase subunit SecG [Acidobacteriota bacterium]
MLYGIIVALHVIVCLILILVVLLQSGKGADLAGAFGGGGSQTAFGSRGPASFLSRMTTAAAIIFMVTSITLSGIGRSGVESSVLDGTETPAAAAPQPVAAEPRTPMPTLDEIKRIQAEVEAKQGQTPQSGTQSASPPPAGQPVKEPPPKKQ